MIMDIEIEGTLVPLVDGCDMGRVVERCRCEVDRCP